MAKKQMNMEDYRAALQAEKEALDKKMEMAEKWTDVMNYIEGQVKCNMEKKVVTPSWRETYTDPETGEEKTKYHWTVYETDENGEDVHYVPDPEESPWMYKQYTQWCEIRDAVLSVL